MYRFAADRQIDYHAYVQERKKDNVSAHEREKKWDVREKGIEFRKATFVERRLLTKQGRTKGKRSWSETRKFLCTLYFFA